MANMDAPHGFKIWNQCLRARMYAVVTAPTINVCVGDIVTSANTGIATAKWGTILEIDSSQVPQATGGATNPRLGAVIAVFDENMDVLQYIAPARVGDGTVAGYVMVADSPDQQFEAQVDSAATAADLDLNYEITSVALCAPDSRTKMSTQEIAISGANTTSTISLRLYGMAYPNDDTLADGCRMICQINPLAHYFGAGTAV